MEWFLKVRATMASMASPTIFHYHSNKLRRKTYKSPAIPPISLSQSPQPNNKSSGHFTGSSRREIILKSSELALIGAIFKLSGKKPDYLGVQKNQQSLALCPATDNCISTSENIGDLTHYAPPWNYNGGKNRKKPVSRQVAMEELLQVIKSTKPDKFTPRIVEQNDNYVHVEYQSPILGLVDDVEFWFPSAKDSIVEYRSASRVGNFDFDANRKRIKALRLELEKKGWASADGF